MRSILRRHVFAVAVFAMSVVQLPQLALAAEPAQPRAVLVTGASTGIGRAITEELAANGFVVYAGARKPADLEALARIPNVRPIRLDVTSDADIAAAVDKVTSAGNGLYGLVNNAGVAVVGSFADTKPEDFDWVMQVNAYGPYRVSRAFQPLIVASKGRITTISSISGVLSSANLGAYSMSKHAIEAFGDSLAVQLAPRGVHVSLIEPGNYDSEIGRTAEKRTGVAAPAISDRAKYKPPTDVADAVYLALTEPQPRRRYMVVPNEQEATVTINKALEELVQLNEGHAYTFDRETLIRMLDAKLANSRPRTPPKN